MSATRARYQFGFDRMTEHSEKVEQALVEAQQIRETVDDIARIKNKALLAGFGIIEAFSSDSSDSEEEREDNFAPYKVSSDVLDICKKTLYLSKFNWFKLRDVLDAQVQQSDDVGRLLEQVYCELPKFGFTEHEVELVVQSKQAYEAAVNDAYDNERTV